MIWSLPLFNYLNQTYIFFIGKLKLSNNSDTYFNTNDETLLEKTNFLLTLISSLQIFFNNNYLSYKQLDEPFDYLISLKENV